MKVFIDPGHGGRDPGVTGNGYRESDLTLEDALAVGAMLIKAGVQVKFSRTTDKYVALYERAKMANAWGADIFISFHINGVESSLATGTETFYYRARSKALAEKMQKTLVDTLGLTNRGVKTRGFVVVKYTKMPAVLLEPFFIGNKHDLNRYLSRRGQLRVNLAKTLLDYLGVKPKKRRAMYQKGRWIRWPRVASDDRVIVGNPHKTKTIKVISRRNGKTRKHWIDPERSISLPGTGGYVKLRSLAVIDSELRLS
ncbi:hypothetical protein LCGC14_1204200 [marine sediment metagenome]|uniref:MurNAc-LAA domain-containing protein n=1 Tax=marine sediment metagenome TaxID=412755 RepID=A0A0F9LG13_9ZZZZ